MRAFDSLVAAATALCFVGCAHGPGSSSEPGSSSPSSSPATSPSSPTCARAGGRLSAFELAVLGSGGPGASGRAASSYLVLVDGKARILIDVGPGAFVRLGQMEVNLEDLDTVLLTHLHIDHAGDLPGFMKSRDLSQSGPLTFRIVGPSGQGVYPSTSAFVDRLFGPQGAFRYLPAFKNQLRISTDDLPTAADAPIHEIMKDGDLRVTAIGVDHGDAPAVAYRIDHAGHAVVVSGDLASKNDNLVRLAAGADLLVYDTTVLDPPASAPPLYELHTSPRRIGEVAAQARVKSLLLSHLAPAVEREQSAVLRSVSRGYSGPTWLAADCLRVDLTTR